jgi:predicted MFS family arabinose efflux permease
MNPEAPSGAPADADTASFRSVLAHQPVRALWIASLISYVGDTFAAMALFISVNAVTHSTLALSAVGLAQTLPLFLGIIAGVLVDRWRYRPVLLVADLLRAALLPLYILFQTPSDLPLVLLVTGATSLAARFFSPSSQALRRALLRPSEYQVAASLWQATMGMSYVVGPALAGLTIAAFGASGTTVAFLVDSFSFLLSAGIIYFAVRREAQAVDTGRGTVESPPAWTDLREGFSIMWRSRAIRGVAILYSLGLLGVGAVFVLAVPYVQRAFGGGPLQIGLLDTSQAFGVALGAVGVGTIAASRFAAGDLMLAASLVGGCGVVALGLAPIYAAALVAMLIAGIAAGTVESAGATVSLHEIPQQHQAKGNATLDTLLNTAYVTSIALAGIGGDLIGVRGVFVAGGLVAILGAALAYPLLHAAAKPGRRAIVEEGPHTKQIVTTVDPETSDEVLSVNGSS